MYSFVDNHDVDRLMSKLNNKDHIREVYTLLYTLPGIPSIYYGSEWGIEGRKQGASDDAMRPQLDLEKMQKENPHPELTAHIAALGKMRKENPVLADGKYRELVLTNRQCIFARETESERVFVAINADENSYIAHFDAGCGQAVDLITGDIHDFGGGSELAPYSAAFWKMER